MGCWIHTRRYFNRALSHNKARTEYALTLAYIGMLYDMESMADDQHMDTIQRMELRKLLAYLIICALEKWCI
ncbi:IS66 family transposase [Phocaeicola vulgatus]|uniref:IS66 family transposase n=1 Tax=Phocaeicola vulgatus TaxID=821 RepID=UPI0021D46802|nr:IS66 family transposase [Phocaeicola vulgatus]